MKELYLAMDDDGLIYGFDHMPILRDGSWGNSVLGSPWYNLAELYRFGLRNIEEFKLKHETPIKIRAVWEVIP